MYARHNCRRRRQQFAARHGYEYVAFEASFASSFDDGTGLITYMSLERDSGNLVIEGTIMGARPVRAVLTPQELRGLFKILDARTVVYALGMLFRKSG
jgi:hypothetical protein